MKRVVQKIFTFLARQLRPWREAPIIDIFPRLVWLRVHAPVNSELLPPGFNSQFVRAKSIPPRRIFFLRNVHVQREGVVFKNLRVFLPSLPWLKDLDIYQRGEVLLCQWQSRNILFVKLAALVYDQWSTCNYYHWMIESLPRLIIVKEKFPHCTLILPDEPMEYIITTIEMLGYKNTITIPKSYILKANDLIFPEIVYYDGVENEDAPPDPVSEDIKNLPNKDPICNCELITLVRETLLKNFSGQTRQRDRRVYVSRSRSKIRRLANEADILPVLEQLRFEIVFFEELSFLAQLNLMLETSILAGVHGANMVNILFLQQGAKVVELMNEEYVNDAYYLLASSIGLPYYSVPCKMKDQSTENTRDTVALNNADLLVDVNVFTRTLEMAALETGCLMLDT